MIMNTGLDWIRNYLHGDAPTAPTHMAVGTGTSFPQATETTLETELLRKTFSTKTKGTTGKETLELTILTTEGNGSDLSEVGILNAASSGDLLNRIAFDPISKTSAFELKIEIELTEARPV